MLEKAELKRLAWLSRIDVDEDELDKFSENFAGIMAMVDKLRQCPGLDGEEAAFSPPPLLRPDVVQPSMSREDFLSNAPAAEAGCILVPKTVGSEEAV